MKKDASFRPAYREPWFWFVMAPLILSVLVSSVVVTLAFRGADDRVYGDYYKQGRMINYRFAAESSAVEQNVVAELEFDSGGRELRLQFSGKQAPDWIEVFVSHPAEADLDRTFTLRPRGEGRYMAHLTEPLQGRRYLVLTARVGDNQVLWRINTEANLDAASVVRVNALAGAASSD